MLYLGNAAITAPRFLSQFLYIYTHTRSHASSLVVPYASVCLISSCRSLCACCMGPPRTSSPAGAAVDATAGVKVKVSDRYVSSPPSLLVFSCCGVDVSPALFCHVDGDILMSRVEIARTHRSR